jgi:hypothetical protein
MTKSVEHTKWGVIVSAKFALTLLTATQEVMAIGGVKTLACHPMRGVQSVSFYQKKQDKEI